MTNHVIAQEDPVIVDWEELNTISQEMGRAILMHGPDQGDSWYAGIYADCELLGPNQGDALYYCTLIPDGTRWSIHRIEGWPVEWPPAWNSPYLDELVEDGWAERDENPFIKLYNVPTKVCTCLMERSALPVPEGVPYEDGWWYCLTVPHHEDCPLVGESPAAYYEVLSRTKSLA